MQSKFKAMCEVAREHISVPNIPLAAVRDAAHLPPPTPSKRRKRVIAGVLCGLVVVGAAAAAELWRGTHVSFGPSGALQMSTVEELGLQKNPSAQDLRNAVERASFHVELPVGLPAGTTLGEMLRGPSFIMLDYNLPGAWRRSNHLLRIALTDPRALAAQTHATKNGTQAYVMHMGGLAATGALHWNVGPEVVIIMNSTATPGEIQNIKRAMMAEAGQR